MEDNENGDVKKKGRHKSSMIFEPEKEPYNRFVAYVHCPWR